MSFECSFAVARFEDDATVFARFDAATRVERAREVDRHVHRVEKVKGPNINCAAGKVHSRRSDGFYDHLILGLWSWIFGSLGLWSYFFAFSFFFFALCSFLFSLCSFLFATNHHQHHALMTPASCAHF